LHGEWAARNARASRGRVSAAAELRRDFGRSDGEEKRTGASRTPAVPALPPVPGS